MNGVRTLARTKGDISFPDSYLKHSSALTERSGNTLDWIAFVPRKFRALIGLASDDFDPRCGGTQPALFHAIGRYQATFKFDRDA